MAKKDSYPILIKAKNVAIKSSQWFWKNWVVKGALNIFSGEGGTGKTGIVFSLMAMEVNKLDFPSDPEEEYPGGISGLKGTGKNVLYIGDDDTMEEQAKPILQSLGADMEKIYFVNGIKTVKELKDEEIKFEEGDIIEESLVNKKNPFILSRDTKPLLRHFRNSTAFLKKFSLIVIDPFSPLVLSAKDSNNHPEVREALTDVRTFCQDSGVTVIGITHSPKGHNTRSVSDMIIGSSAIRDYSRHAVGFLRCNKRGNHEGRTLMVQIKSNRAPSTGGFLVGFEPFVPTGTDDYGIKMETLYKADLSKAKYVRGSADILRKKYTFSPLGESEEEDIPEKILEAEKWLEDLLKKHRNFYLAQKIHDEREKRKISKDSYSKAYNRLKCRVHRNRGEKGGLVFISSNKIAQEYAEERARKERSEEEDENPFSF